MTDTAPRPYWAARPPHVTPLGPYRVAVVRCRPGDAMGLLHPQRTPGQTIVAPQWLAAYHTAAWAAAHSAPVGQVVELTLAELPLGSGQWSTDRPYRN